MEATVCWRSQPDSWEKSKECAWTVWHRQYFRVSSHREMCSRHSIATVRSNRSPFAARALARQGAPVSAQRSAQAHHQWKIARMPCSRKAEKQGWSQRQRCGPRIKLDAEAGEDSWDYSKLPREMSSFA